MLPAKITNRSIELSSLNFALNEEQVRIARDQAQTITAVEKRSGLSYDDFFKNYLVPNKPVIITDLHTNFLCTQHWTKLDNNVRRPNFEYLSQNFGASKINVAQCNEQQYNDQKRLPMNFQEYITYWKTRIEQRNNCPKQEHESDTDEDTCPKSRDYLDASLLYLKDWHLIQQYPQHDVYILPVLFSEDWLNDYWDKLNLNDDYRFVYMGPKHSWTPLHSDVLRSYSWSTNICGRKLWIFFPPSQEEFFKDSHGNTVYDVLEHVDKKQFPNFHRCTPIKVIQEAGETIYVPSGWFHQVHNLEDTISINHNWFNACNLDLCWNFIRADLILLEKCIEHIRDTFSEDEYLEHCQVMLRASSGIDYLEFIMLLTQIASAQLTHVIDSQKIGTKTDLLALYNLNRITQVLRQVLNEKLMCKYQQLHDAIVVTLDGIESFVLRNKSG
jgi:hypothetical protein